MKKILNLWREWWIGPVEVHKSRLLEKQEKFFRSLIKAKEMLYIEKRRFCVAYLVWFRHGGVKYKAKLMPKSRAWMLLSYNFGDKTFFPSPNSGRSRIQIILWERLNEYIGNLLGSDSPA